ncbi:MAG: bifunctional folylpolyglutamate synthase/dihydrofolate synthase [Gammaproteobacteria bacterium]|nr:bifunctional folylpolyglutamate synthase/dihydrofolate synthase [Gammaproteobacteria bacterium]
MRFNHLDDWLAWQETLNPAEIDLRLDRVGRVLSLAKLSSSFNCPLITVAGTNGKGSVAAMLEAIAMAAGLNICSYTSPHIFRYNERIKINGRAVDDNSLCEAFERIDQARGDIPVTYFEFGTLAAIELFHRQQPDLVILEVGLGGRLDAVNIMDADISVLTSIAIDHVDWLGDNREAIGFEKAGIFRAGKTVICGEISPPESVIKHAQALQCEIIRYGRDYAVLNTAENGDGHDASWTLKSCLGDIAALPSPSLAGDFQKANAATAVVALQALVNKGMLSVPAKLRDEDWLQRAIISGLRNIKLAGRYQLIKTSPQVYVDVAHNPQAALSLKSLLDQSAPARSNKTWAIVAMLADKDVAGVINSVAASIDCWCFAGLENASRGLAVEAFVSRLPASIDIPDTVSHETLGNELSANQCTMLSENVLLAKTVATACRFVLSKADKNDRIIIFGSFYTVSEAMQFFASYDE